MIIDNNQLFNRSTWILLSHWWIEMSTCAQNICLSL